MNFDNGRILLEPEPELRSGIGFDVVMIGHTGAAANLAYLFTNTRMVRELENAGYVEKLQALRLQLESGEEADDLFNLPLPVQSLAEFNALFSSSPVTAETQPYASRLAGYHKWLPRAVRDFFVFQRRALVKKLWIIPVDPNLKQEAFLPLTGFSLLETDNDNAFIRAMALPQAALILLPDYERLQIPANLEPPPRLRLANPPPSFLPCASNADDGISERNLPGEFPQYPAVEDFGAGVSRMLAALERFRPDLRLLLSLPYDEKMNGELPQASQAALDDLQRLKTSANRHSLHKLQLVFPYLMAADKSLSSSCGLLAGLIASQSISAGPWKSVAGQNLPGDFEPWPSLSQKQIALFRDEVGLGVLHMRVGRLQLDDERLSAGVFSAAYNTGAGIPNDASGEISRFMGWLYRSLENLGMELVFDVETVSRKAFIRLNDFFTRLFQLGALRGKTAEEAYRLEQQVDSDRGTLIFTIAIAPAFPIDTIVISINRDGVSFTNG